MDSKYIHTLWIFNKGLKYQIIINHVFTKTYMTKKRKEYKSEMDP